MPESPFSEPQERMKILRSMEEVTTGVSRWLKRADPARGVPPAPNSGVSPIPRPRIALTCEAGGPWGPV